MGSVAAARRTQSSFAALVKTTNPSQVDVSTAIASPGIGNGQGYDPAIVREIAQIPHVTAVASSVGVVNAEPPARRAHPSARAACTPYRGAAAWGA